MEQQTQNNGAPRIAEEAEVSGAQQPMQQPVQQTEAQQVDHSFLEDAIAQLQGGLDLKVQEVRDDRRLTKEEQRAKITDLWNRASAAYPEILKSYERKLREDVDEREQSLFHVPLSLRDSVRAAYSDARDRTEAPFMSGEADGVEYAREELRRLFGRAVKTGDRALETALGQLAIERGGPEEVVTSYLGRSEEKTAQAQRLAEARQKLAHWQDPQERNWMRITRAITLVKPEEA
jgi:molecular chaperone GrpE (heat shock protein)